MNTTAHKIIDATEMLKSKFKEPVTCEYQMGWNDALQAAYDTDAQDAKPKNKKLKENYNGRK